MTSLLDELDARARTFTAPIRPDAPAGVPARHVPAYETVAQEIAKLESPTAGEVTWPEVVRLSGTLLRETTQDLPLAAYLGYGLFVTEGMAGAAVGSLMLAELLEHRWTSVFPEVERLRARANAVGWFVERLRKSLERHQASAPERDAIDALSTGLERLSRLSQERFGKLAPAFGNLRESCAKLRATLNEPAAPPSPSLEAAPSPPPETAPTPAPDASAPAASVLAASVLAATASAAPVLAASAPAATALAAAAAPAPPPELRDLPQTSADPGNGREAMKNLSEALTALAAQIRRADPTAPLGYRVLRAGMWLSLDSPPQVRSGNRTSVPPLPKALRTRLDRLAENAKWPELLEEAESAMPQFVFALELQRLSMTALSNLGASHAGARAAVVHELRAFLSRVPGLETLEAADGTPLLDPETRALAHAPGTPRPPRLPAQPLVVPSAPPPPPGTDTPQDIVSQARELFRTHGAEHAVQLVQGSILSSGSERQRFIYRLSLAGLCIEWGEFTLARVLYEALEADAIAWRLAEWEPALVAVCLEGLLSVTSLQQVVTDASASRNDDRFKSLAKLDLAAALRVQRKLSNPESG